MNHRTMNDEIWVQGLPMYDAPLSTACVVCRHAIVHAGKCAQKCCANGGVGCTPPRREGVDIPKGFH